MKLYLAIQRVLKPWLGEESLKSKADAGLLMLQLISMVPGLRKP